MRHHLAHDLTLPHRVKHEQRKKNEKSLKGKLNSNMVDILSLTTTHCVKYRIRTITFIKKIAF